MDLTRLRPVYEHDGPYLTVHAEVGRATQDAAAQLDARWTTIRHELEHRGVPAGLVSDIGDRLHENPHAPGEVRRTIVAAGDEVLLDDVQIGHSHWPEVLDQGDLPDLTGWLGMEERAIPFLVVVADRTGADIDVHRALSKPTAEHETVTGETFYITKVPQGDWAQKQFQQTAEDSWQHNAREVADAVRTLARRHRPRAVFVAGEVRARAEVTKALEESDPEPLGQIIQLESGGRGAGASSEAMRHEIRAKLAELERTADAEVAAELDRVRGQGAGGAAGIEQVLDALAQHQVERLVIDPAALSEKVVHPKDHVGLLLPPTAAEADELPADRVLVAAASLSGAEISLLPSSMSHGGGAAALLRWAEPPV
jgi:hypothetical protein